MEPQNSVMSDSDIGVDLPQAEPDEQSLVEEKKMAKYSQSAEYGRLKEHFEAKIAHWQQYLPGSDSKILTELSREERADKWAIADEIIKELQNIMITYEQINQIVKDAAKVSSP